jgi:tryptophan halogenase
MSKLGAKWQSYSDCLKVNSAITFQTPVEEEFNIYTLAHAKNAGWMFRIPVWDRYGNGYIYDSNFITKEQAAQEMFEHFGKEIEIGREFKFDPGSLKQVWISNCCAIGLSSSFFEPLEATSIGSSILQTFCLMDMLVNYDERTITEYNKHINDLFLNIRDFVFLHYLGGRNDTDFWKYVSTIKIPESLQYNLEKWENKIPIQLDFDGTSHYRMFNSGNFTQILYGLNKFNVDSIKKQFDYIPDLLTVAAKHKLQEKLLKNELMPKIGHKEYITALRTIYSKKKRMEAESHYF